MRKDGNINYGTDLSDERDYRAEVGVVWSMKESEAKATSKELKETKTDDMAEEVVEKEGANVGLHIEDWEGRRQGCLNILRRAFRFSFSFGQEPVPRLSGIERIGGKFWVIVGEFAVVIRGRARRNGGKTGGRPN